MVSSKRYRQKRKIKVTKVIYSPLIMAPTLPGCIPCKVYAEDTPILTIDSIVICQTHAEYLRRRLLKMHPGHFVILNALQYFLTSGIFSSQDDDRKSKLDPMVKINAFLDETKQTESWKKEKRQKEKKQRKVVNRFVISMFNQSCDSPGEFLLTFSCLGKIQIREENNGRLKKRKTSERKRGKSPSRKTYQGKKRRKIRQHR
jgi:hypothetical protein